MAESQGAQSVAAPPGILQTVEQLTAFNDVARLLLSMQDIKDVVQTLTVTVTNLLGQRHWSLALWSDERFLLQVEAALGHGGERLMGLGFNSGEGVVGEAYAERTLVQRSGVTADMSIRARFGDAMPAEGVSVLAVPLLVVRGQGCGVLELVRLPTEEDFSHSEVEAVIQIAELAGLAIENARSFQRIERLTVTDDVTGLYNTRHFRQLLDNEVARSRRFRHSASLLFIDLDEFKAINDKHGHLVGTSVLREVGQMLGQSIRRIDSAFRYGGDEFGLLLLETDADGANAFARRVLDALRQRRFLVDRGLSIALTASVGVATFPLHTDSPEGLIHAADLAMYEVKKNGRNGVQLAKR